LFIFVYHSFKKNSIVSYENKQQGEQRNESIYTKRVKAGKRRTYFFDVRATKGSDFFITITESKKRFDDNGYDRHKIFLYKEDFNKFVAAMTETVNYVKTDLMPDFDFDAFNHDQEEDGEYVPYSAPAAAPSAYIADAPVQETPSALPSADDDSGMDAWKI
jgi:hypothetical protein